MGVRMLAVTGNDRRSTDVHVYTHSCGFGSPPGNDTSADGHLVFRGDDRPGFDAPESWFDAPESGVRRRSEVPSGCQAGPER